MKTTRRTFIATGAAAAGFLAAPHIARAQSTIKLDLVDGLAGG